MWWRKDRNCTDSNQPTVCFPRTHSSVGDHFHHTVSFAPEVSELPSLAHLVSVHYSTDMLTCSGPPSSLGTCVTSLTRKWKTVLPVDRAEVKCDVKALCVHRQVWVSVGMGRELEKQNVACDDGGTDIGFVIRVVGQGRKTPLTVNRKPPFLYIIPWKHAYGKVVSLVFPFCILWNWGYVTCHTASSRSGEELQVRIWKLGCIPWL